MLNKTITPLLLAAVLAVPVSAQTQTKTPTKQTAATQARQELRSRRFDPRNPSLSATIISNLLDGQIRKKLLEKKQPEKLEDIKEDNSFTNAQISQLLFAYEVLTKNPDLEEVSRVPLRWYTAYGDLLKPFGKIVERMNYARHGNSQTRYAAALEDFQKQQQTCLSFLKKRQPRLTSEQLLKIRNANIRRRRAEYNARLKKEREERLKKLQEENSQKNTEE